MVNLDPKATADRFRDDELNTIHSALETLRKVGFLHFLMDDAKRQLVDKFGDQSEEELAKEIREMRQDFRVIFTLIEMTQTLERIIEDAQES